METARELTSRLADLLRDERTALADFLVALAGVDAERRWLELGYASAFDFLHRELGLSKGSAFYRKTAAALIQKFPEIVEPLRDGRLCLTTIVEVARVLTPENLGDVLPRFFHQSKSEAKAVAAELCPMLAPPRRDVVTVAGRTDPRALATTTLPLENGQAVHLENQLLDIKAAAPSTSAPPLANSATALASNEPAAPPAHDRDGREPLTRDLTRLHLTVSREFLGKLEAARAALSHSHPGASAQELLQAGLDLLLERHAKRKGITSKPRREPPPSSPEHVPAHVRRAVWKRDGGRCQWPLASGTTTRAVRGRG